MCMRWTLSLIPPLKPSLKAIQEFRSFEYELPVLCLAPYFPLAYVLIPCNKICFLFVYVTESKTEQERAGQREVAVRHSACPLPGLVTADGSHAFRGSWTAAEREKPGWTQPKSTKQQEMVWLADDDRAGEGGGMSAGVNFHIKELCCLESSYSSPCNNSYLALWTAM